jgi:lipoic acid synthetase
MELDYVVLTSVNRDDLPDQGSLHFASCIREIRRQSPETLVEVLIPDFQGKLALLQNVLQAGPDVLAHNVEAVPRLQRPVRDPRANWEQSLKVLEAAKKQRPGQHTKTSIQLGHGESVEEVVEAMKILRSISVDFLTLGQYLQPSPTHLAVTHWVTPEDFAFLEKAGLELGFKYVASGPLVRSSYKAGEFFINQYLRNHSGGQA